MSTYIPMNECKAVISAKLKNITPNVAAACLDFVNFYEEAADLQNYIVQNLPSQDLKDAVIYLTDLVAKRVISLNICIDAGLNIDLAYAYYLFNKAATGEVKL